MRKELLALAEQMHVVVSPALKAMIEAGDYEALQAMLNNLREEWRLRYGTRARRLAGQWVGAANAESKRRFSEGIKDALGVDFAAIFDGPAITQAVQVMGTEAVNLISSIPDQYFQDIQEAVLKNYMGQPLPDGRSLIDQIEETYKVSRERAALIARDQTSKINTAVTQARCEELGIETYKWRTVRDIRVVGNPDGLFPKGSRAHGNHFEREGKRYYWRENPNPEDGIRNPPEDGPPGWAINCRCTAESVIDIDKLKFV
ncbi:MAG: hypothetical protein LBJ14_04755 [Desulfarculales bacterium]|jgi:uncharacterized protein with gpF-like domain|nr:hypothetical protein [Desulfarculales bacterium]